MSHTARLILLVGGGVAAGWLLPSAAVPESRVAVGAAGAALSATARVAFKIIIPPVLYVRVGDMSENVREAGIVAVRTNNHNATLNAAVRSLDSTATARGTILTSAARKGIAQNVQCAAARAPPTGRNSAAPAAGSSAAGDGAPRQLICTVSMP